MPFYPDATERVPPLNQYLAPLHQITTVRENQGYHLFETCSFVAPLSSSSFMLESSSLSFSSEEVTEGMSLSCNLLNRSRTSAGTLSRSSLVSTGPLKRSLPCGSLAVSTFLPSIGSIFISPLSSEKTIWALPTSILVDLSALPSFE